MLPPGLVKYRSEHWFSVEGFNCKKIFANVMKASHLLNKTKKMIKF